MNKRIVRNLSFAVFVFILLLIISAPIGCTPERKGDKQSIEKSKSREGITVCTFNIKWLGFYNRSCDSCSSLSSLVKNSDIVLIQELVAPVVSGTYPDGSGFSAEPKAETFLREMQKMGFVVFQAEEDTGRNANHSTSTGSEWPVVFYRPDVVSLARDLPHGYLDRKLVQNSVYDRVPYAFPFRTTNSLLDFVLISVHLRSAEDAVAERQKEVMGIVNWIGENDRVEKDFIFAGDFNFQTTRERGGAIPKSYSVLFQGDFTNTRGYRDSSSQKPYDNAVYRPMFTSEIDKKSGMKRVNIFEKFKIPLPATVEAWRRLDMSYSDHCPMTFRMMCPASDDD